MNERIRQLSEQAEKYADYNFKGEHFWTQAYESKFAELIVQKCADIGAQHADGNYEVPNQILEYFGMQEPKE